MNIDGHTSHIILSRFATMAKETERHLATEQPNLKKQTLLFFCTFLHSLARTDIYDLLENV